MIEFKIGQTVQRTDPGGDKVVREVQCEDDVSYHTGLQSKGYKYELITAPIKKPRLYTGAPVCESCEG